MGLTTNQPKEDGDGGERDPDRRYRRDREREREQNYSRSHSPGRRDFRRNDRPYERDYMRRYLSNRGARSYQSHRNADYHDDRHYNVRDKRSTTRLVVDKIPLEYCSIAKINEYFQRFGNIVNITVHPEIQRARLEFSTKEEANNAYMCPDVIFENRFVKVYWDYEDLPAPIIRSNVASGTTKPSVLFAPNDLNNAPSKSSFATTRIEAAQKKQEALKGMFELQKHKQDLLLKYIAEQKEILTLLENKTMPETEKQEMVQTLKSIDDLIKSLNMSSLDETSTKAQFDVNGQSSSSASNSAPPSTTTTPVLRGGPTFRGRGGRGAFADPKASFAAHRLDLRPTAFMINPIPLRIGRDIGSIRKVFEPYGEIKNITMKEDTAIISFVKRIDAEKAQHYISRADFGDPFEVQWVSSVVHSYKPSETVGIAPMDENGGDGDNDHIPFEDGESHWKR